MLVATASQTRVSGWVSWDQYSAQLSVRFVTTTVSFTDVAACRSANVSPRFPSFWARAPSTQSSSPSLAARPQVRNTVTSCDTSPPTATTDARSRDTTCASSSDGSTPAATRAAKRAPIDVPMQWAIRRDLEKKSRPWFAASSFRMPA